MSLMRLRVYVTKTSFPYKMNSPRLPWSLLPWVGAMSAWPMTRQSPTRGAGDHLWSGRRKIPPRIPGSGRDPFILPHRCNQSAVGWIACPAKVASCLVHTRSTHKSLPRATTHSLRIRSRGRRRRLQGTRLPSAGRNGMDHSIVHDKQSCCRHDMSQPCSGQKPLLCGWRLHDGARCCGTAFFQGCLTTRKEEKNKKRRKFVQDKKKRLLSFSLSLG